MNRLPPELLVSVLSYLDPVSIDSFLTLNRQFHCLIHENWNKMQRKSMDSLNISGIYDVNEEYIKWDVRVKNQAKYIRPVVHFEAYLGKVIFLNGGFHCEPMLEECDVELKLKINKKDRVGDEFPQKLLELLENGANTDALVWTRSQAFRMDEMDAQLMKVMGFSTNSEMMAEVEKQAKCQRPSLKRLGIAKNCDNLYQYIDEWPANSNSGRRTNITLTQGPSTENCAGIYEFTKEWLANPNSGTRTKSTITYWVYDATEFMLHLIQKICRRWNFHSITINFDEPKHFYVHSELLESILKSGTKVHTISTIMEGQTALEIAKRIGCKLQLCYMSQLFEGEVNQLLPHLYGHDFHYHFLHQDYCTDWGVLIPIIHIS